MLKKTIVQTKETVQAYTTKILQKLQEKKGAMSTIEMVVLIALVLIIGGILMSFFKSNFPNLLTMIWGKVEALFNAAP